MSKEALDFDDLAQEAPVTVAGRVDPQLEDKYWEDSYLREGYYSAGLAYEDYAPAYCVGYIGYAQYGGVFDDAEKSLCANWLRIKGDSRLNIGQALPAMRAAWERMVSSAATRQLSLSHPHQAQQPISAGMRFARRSAYPAPHLA